MKLRNLLLVYSKPATKEEKSALNTVVTILKKYKINYNKADRENLNGKLFQNKDLITVLGGDGTFLKASHFVFDKTPLFGVNSHPRYKEGFFMVAVKKDFERNLKRIMKNNFEMKKIQRLEAYIGNKKIQEPALNEYYVASEKQHHTARYFLNVRGEKEKQKSSGILISTAAGSNAWIKSAGGKVLPLNSKKFEYLAREPYCGRVSAKCSLVNGILNKNEKLEIVFESSKGVLIADSLGKEHKFKAGHKVMVKISKKPLHVVSFNNGHVRI